MRSLTHLATPHLLIFLALFSFSCGSDDKDEASDSSTLNFTRVYNEVMSNTTGLSCAQCHVTGGEANTDYGVTLDLTTVTAAESGIKNGTARSSGTLDCNGAKYVAATNPNGSYLYAVMGGVTAANFTGKSGCTPTNRHFVGSTAIGISASQVQLIKQWIEAGAP